MNDKTREHVERVRGHYLRHDKAFPHVWCPGCGNGIVLGSLVRAIDRIGLDKNEIALVSGIGCAGRLSAYVDFHTLHTTHGRALTFATGVKLAKPSLTVLAVMGDGDATGIGGNHFIHAARRNLNLTAVIINNLTYGMTGGQYSPTTPYQAHAATAVHGNIEHAFSIAELAVTAGASYVARGTVYHVPQLDRLLEQGIRKNGFSVIEIMSNCHTQFGRRNNMGDPVTMMKWLRDHALPAKQAGDLPPESMEGKFTIGVLADLDKPDYCEEYRKIQQRAQAALGNQ